MDLEKVIMERRSVRTFQDLPVEKEKIEKLCNAAIWAPSGGNSQPWVFIPVTEPKTVKLIKAISPGLLGLPPAVIVILSDREYNVKKMGAIGETLAEMDCCFAAQNILLQAHNLGLGACVIRSFNQKALREIVKVPEGILPELLIICGYPASNPPPPPRKTEVIHWESYTGSKNG
jgi:nitroreductase